MTRGDEEIEFVTKHVREAITDEWFAHFQYWIGSVIVGDRCEHVVDQFKEHSVDEYDHAAELAMWLRNFPRKFALPYAMSELPKHQYCGYIYPSGNTVQTLVLDAIRGERCAIDFYDAFLVDIYTMDFYERNPVEKMLERILEKEREHRADLEHLLETF